MTLALGLMSGTSGDGASLALAEFTGRKFKIHGYATYPFPAALGEKIATGRGLAAPEISRLNAALGIFFADCAVKFLAKYPRKRPAVIGSHGQTIYHGGRETPANTLQIGEPCFIAAKTGVPVVADFRMADLAAGGEGAPLIPFFDRHFFGGGRPKALQNIGGISNVTLVGKTARTVAFDNGPGNCLIDWAVKTITNGRESFDRAGRLAARGHVNMLAVKEMAAHPYFEARPPKSTGRETFNESFLPPFLLREPPENLVATLTYFTAYAIKQSYERFLPSPPAEVIVSGGGALNTVLMNYLKQMFTVPVRSIEETGIPAQAKEPVAFAFFAACALRGDVNHWPAGTGAKSAAILGKICPAPPRVKGKRAAA